MNSFSSQTDNTLEQIGTAAGVRLSASYAQYGISKELAELVDTLSGSFHTLRGTAKTQYDLAKQATGNKDAGRDALLDALAQVSNAVYAPDSTVTDAQLSAIGFAPRHSTSPHPKIAQRVTNLVATPNGLDGVVLTYDRVGNPKSTNFQVFASADSGATWTMVASSNRVKVEVPLAPGTPMAYRIVAKASTTTSAPSQAVTVYGAQIPSEAVVLELQKGGADAGPVARKKVG